jgi:hypothetical protein
MCGGGDRFAAATLDYGSPLFSLCIALEDFDHQDGTMHDTAASY